jgi:hypothetical protein
MHSSRNKTSRSWVERGQLFFRNPSCRGSTESNHGYAFRNGTGYMDFKLSYEDRLIRYFGFRTFFSVLVCLLFAIWLICAIVLFAFAMFMHPSGPETIWTTVELLRFDVPCAFDIEDAPFLLGDNSTSSRWPPLFTPSAPPSCPLLPTNNSRSLNTEHSPKSHTDDQRPTSLSTSPAPEAPGCRRFP